LPKPLLGDSIPKKVPVRHSQRGVQPIPMGESQMDTHIRISFATMSCCIFLAAGCLMPRIASAQVETILHKFGSVADDGANPEAPVTLSGSTLYGVTNVGGHGFGTVFRINTDGTGYKILHSFGSGSGFTGDGFYPVAAPTVVGSTLYGTTTDGGGSGYAGIIFKIGTDGTGYKILHKFGASNDGQDPEASLTLVGSTLYGTTNTGGNDSVGTIFQINTNGAGYKVVYNFGSIANDGGYPGAALTLVGSTFYGTTESGIGSSYNRGTIFQINTDGSGYLVIYNFGSVINDGYDSHATLTLVGSTLYGTTEYGGPGDSGILFQINTNGSGYTAPYYFTGGAIPSSLTLAGTTLYGATEYTGTSNSGSIFEANTDGSGMQTIYSFGGSGDGFYPLASLTPDGSALYGTTDEGGLGSGTVFRFGSPGPSVPEAQPGKYTLLFTATDTSAEIPQGTGYATLTVSKNGGVVMAGKLADDESFSTSGFITGTASNQFIFDKTLKYASVTPSGTKGSLMGTITFVTVTGTSDLSGTMEWIKPSQTKGAYPGMIDTNLAVIGSLYTYAKGDSVLPGFTTGTLEFSDTGTFGIMSFTNPL
jgi:uncharacterized repeat protein (TIGR03803 family)